MACGVEPNIHISEGRRCAQRRLEEAFAYVILDARYEKVQESGSIRSRAVLVAIGIDREGRRQVLGVELAKRENASSWQDFLLTLRQRGPKGVELVVRTMPDYAKRLPKCCLKRSGSAVMSTFFAIPWITCPAREMTIACGSEAGSMTAGMCMKPARTWRVGCNGGRTNMPCCATGLRTTSGKPSPFTVCPMAITSTSSQPTCWSGSIASLALLGERRLRLCRNYGFPQKEERNNQANVVTKRSYGFRTYGGLITALNYSASNLPTPKTAHRFC